MVEDCTTLLFPSQGRISVPLCPPDGLVCSMAAGPGGHALKVMFDTGTDPSAIDLRLARRLALPVGGSGRGVGAVSDEVPFTEAVLPWLRIGNLTIRNLFAPALDLRSTSFDVDIVLGYNVLRQLALRIDYRRREIGLAHPDLGALALGPYAQQLPLGFFEQFPALADVVIADQHVAQATIDTGSNAELTVGPDLAARLGLHGDRAGTRIERGAGFGGGGAVLRGEHRRVCVGPLVLADVEIDAPRTDRGDLSRAGRANIGNRLLARFAAVALDYERRLLLIEPVR
jgi:hypothetical protein